MGLIYFKILTLWKLCIKIVFSLFLIIANAIHKYLLNKLVL